MPNPDPDIVAILARRAGLEKALADHRADLDAAAQSAASMRAKFQRDLPPAAEPALILLPRP